MVRITPIYKPFSWPFGRGISPFMGTKNYPWLLTTYENWDDPPSGKACKRILIQWLLEEIPGKHLGYMKNLLVKTRIIFHINPPNLPPRKIFHHQPGSTISTLLHDKINPKNCQVLSLGDSGFLQFFRVVSRDYGKPRQQIVREMQVRSGEMQVRSGVYVSNPQW